MNRDLAIAVAVGACPLAAYVATLPPSFGVWDTAELQTVAWILGIAHPPGCPAFVLLGYGFVHLVPFGEPAWRLNAMCALAVAASAGLLYAVARRFEIEVVPSVLCASGFAFAYVPWTIATHAEIQDVALLFRVLALWFAFRFVDRGAGRDLFSVGLATGLAIATHGIALFVLPAVALAIAARRQWEGMNSLALLGGGLVLGVLPYAYVPLRSAFVVAHRLDPAAALGLPVGLPFWNYDDPSTPANFMRFVTAADFHVGAGFAGFVDLRNYPHYAAQLGAQFSHAYGWFGALLALGGACLLLGSRRLDRVAIVVAGLLPVPYTEAYTDLQQPQRYYLLSLWCGALAIGIAFDYLATLFELRANSVGQYAAALALAASLATAAPERGQIADQRHDRFGPDFTAEVRGFTPDDGILLVGWGYATPLAYASYVDRSFGHRTVVPAGATQYLAYVRGWLARRPLYIVGFDSKLKIPGWKVVAVKTSTYYAYRLSK